MKRAEFSLPPRPTAPSPDVRVSPMQPEDAEAADSAGVSVARRWWDSAVPARFRDARLADLSDRPAIHDDLRGWAQADERPNLVILGPVGVGKTHAATAAIRGPVGRGARAGWYPIGEMLDLLDWRRPNSGATLTELCTVDLLVIDDLGTERANEWTGERVYTVVNRRWLEQRPTIATSNLTPEELTEAIGERTYSRLVGGALVLALAGSDRRKTTS